MSTAAATATRMETYSQAGMAEEEEGQTPYGQEELWAETVPPFGNRPAASTTASIAMPSVRGTMREPFRSATTSGRQQAFSSPGYGASYVKLTRCRTVLYEPWDERPPETRRFGPLVGTR